MKRAIVAAAVAALLLPGPASSRRHLPHPRQIITCDQRGCSDWVRTPAAEPAKPQVRQTPAGERKRRRRHVGGSRVRQAHARQAGAARSARIEEQTPSIPLPRPDPRLEPSVSRETGLPVRRVRLEHFFRTEPVRPGYVAIRSRSGVTAVVAEAHAWRFAGLVRDLEALGYPVRDLGGYVHRRIAGTRYWSKHASGLALDVNQEERNVVSAPYPPGISKIAARWGLESGGDWKGNPDLGHFEVPGPVAVAGRRHHRHHHRTRLASR